MAFLPCISFQAVEDEFVIPSMFNEVYSRIQVNVLDFLQVDHFVFFLLPPQVNFKVGLCTRHHIIRFVGLCHKSLWSDLLLLFSSCDRNQTLYT